MTKQIIAICLIFSTHFVFAQSLDHRLGEILIQTENDQHPHVIIHELLPQSSHSGISLNYEALNAEMNIWTLTFDYNLINEIDLLSHLKELNEVQNAQFNYFINFRKVPNDLLFDEQWQYLNVGQLGGPVGIDLKMNQVWDVTTGGVTSEGDTIVICVIDDGMDPDHMDILPNLWRNHDEIPNNDIDDDNNGYTDDYLGWNVQSNDDDIFKSGRHGTPVAGIVGAKGNNGIGVTGMNWDVKLMIISGISDIASVIAAYSFPLKMRKIYNRTGGDKGAYIVATNASWGISDLFPDDAPIWCALYDSLGEAGILNCGAAPNDDVDIDQVGDLPSTCTSEYLIGITNINHRDQLQAGSGYGAKSIDLGAFGEDVYTIAKGNTYRSFGGTSGATPHVTGAIGLLYASSDCNNLAQLSKSFPSEATLAAKSYILENTKPINDLSNISTTGGRLDILAAISSVNPLILDYTEDVTAQISWPINMGSQNDTIRWRIKGSSSWTTNIYSGFNHLLLNLSPCTLYEVQLKGICSNDTNSYTNSFEFKTLGCCKLPDEMNIHLVEENSISLKFSDVFAANFYQFEYKSSQSTEWTEISIQKIDSNIYKIDQLSTCTDYLIRVKTQCSDSTSALSDSFSIRTLGCGACLDQYYCITSVKPISTSDWIQNISIAGVSNESGNDDGIGDYTMINPAFNFVNDSSYDINVTIGNTGSASNEILRGWIDYNQDGIFTDSELILAPLSFVTGQYDGKFTVPTNALAGHTRMRFVIKWPGFDGTIPKACDEIEFGEIEDYCVSIDSVFNCPIPQHLDTISTTSSSISLRWDEIVDASGYILNYTLSDMEPKQWKDTTVADNEINIEGLDKCTKYDIRVRTLCVTNNILSEWSDEFEFSTRCTSNSEQISSHEIQIYPNPFNHFISINGSKEIDQVEFYYNGKKVHQSKDLHVDTYDWSKGLYIVLLTTGDEQIVRKLVKF